MNKRSDRPEYLLPAKAVQDRIACGNTKFYAMLKNGEFPPGVRCGPRSVRWKESDVDAWIASRLVVDPQKAARSEAA